MVFVEKECCVWYSFYIIKDGYYYVDKTNLIKDLLNSGSKVTLFTRPRRFGKSLNMDMLKSFFKIDTDISLFDGLAVSNEKELCEKYQGKFPIIAISLKNVDGITFEDFIENLRLIVCETIKPLKNILFLDDYDKEYIKYVTTNNFKSITDLSFSLKIMSRLLYNHYGKRVIVLIDEYDVPLNKAYQRGFYDEMINFISVFLGSVLKTNEYLEFAVLTGCLRVFTGLNNFEPKVISDVKFSEYFGFTDGEVKEMLEYYGLINKYTFFKEWYGGYRFGNTEIYCPWDVISQCKLLCRDVDAPMQPCWINSNSNDIVRDILNGASANTKEQIKCLVSGESIRRVINTDLTYADLKSADKVRKETYLWSILYATGYLTDAARHEGKIHTLVIPNKEILETYRQVLTSLSKSFDS